MWLSRVWSERRESHKEQKKAFKLLDFIWEFIREWNEMIIREWNGMYLNKGKEWNGMELSNLD